MVKGLFLLFLFYSLPAASQMEDHLPRTSLGPMQVRVVNQQLTIFSDDIALWAGPKVESGDKTAVEDITLAVDSSRLIVFLTYDQELAIGANKGTRYLRLEKPDSPDLLKKLATLAGEVLESEPLFHQILSRRKRIAYLKKILDNCQASQRTPSQVATEEAEKEDDLVKKYSSKEAFFNMQLSSCKNNRPI